MKIFNRHYNVKENFLIFSKYLLSFLKNKWVIDDYPIRSRIQKGVSKKYRWHLSILNWDAMGGLGPTKEKAYEDLTKNFKRFKPEGNKFPRPGVKVPIKFAPNKEISKSPRLFEDFISKILGFKKERILYISDMSTLGDLLDGKNLKEYFSKIKKIYSVDVSDIKDGNISKILNRIANRRRLLKKIFNLMNRFILKEITGKMFADYYMDLWANEIRGKFVFSDDEQDILNELHSDCDCLDYPIEDETSREISLTEKQLREIVKNKLTKLKELAEK